MPFSTNTHRAPKGPTDSFSSRCMDKDPDMGSNIQKVLSRNRSISTEVCKFPPNVVASSSAYIISNWKRHLGRQNHWNGFMLLIEAMHCEGAVSSCSIGSIPICMHACMIRFDASPFAHNKRTTIESMPHDGPFLFFFFVGVTVVDLPLWSILHPHK